MIGMSQQRLESSASDAANTLCLYCKDLASAISTTLAIIDSATPDQNKHQSVEVDFRRHDTYPTFPSITLSAEEGCQLCSAFITMMHPYLWVDIPPFKGYLRVLCIRKRNQEDIITENTLKIDFRDPDRAEKLVPFIGGFFNLDIRDPNKYSFTMSPDIFSEENIQFVKGTLSECDESPGDNSCQAAGNFLPTRLLDVGDEDVPDSDVRLVLSETLQDPSTAYVALTYCWGNSLKYVPFTTTAATFRQRLDRITVEELPATLRDAVTVTRALGYRFIWIDSLCILQGNEQDWETQSAMMAQIYRGATLTIAATQASHSDEGFLSSSQSRVVDIGEFLLFPLSLYASPKMYENWSLLTSLEQSAWAQRAWTLQEYKLSRRILLFGSLLHFKCLCHESSEFNRRGNRYLHKHTTQPNSGFRDLTEPYASWCDAVTQYGGRQMTRLTDRLPAISGLAHFFKESSLHSDDYLAGLWKNDLLNQLLWMGLPRYDSNKISYAAPITSDYIAPTWSWASHIGGVHFGASFRLLVPEGVFVQRYVSIIEAQTTVLGTDEMGRVSAAHLRLRGPTRWYGDGADLNTWHLWDGIKLDSGPWRNPRCPQTCAILFSCDFDTLKCKEEVFNLDEEGLNEMRGLVLQRLPEEMDGREVFVRIGMFVISLAGKGKLTGNFADPESLRPVVFSDCPSEEVIIV